MSEIAQVENGIVIQVIVGDIEWAENNLGGTWIKTPNKVGVGYSCHGDYFRPPQPFPSWTWNEKKWNAPIPIPSEDDKWLWNEENQEWINTTL